jgi:hypothetical protein
MSLIKLWAQTEYGSSFETAMSGKAKVLPSRKNDMLDPKRPATTSPKN